jgi:hypothetical protein
MKIINIIITFRENFEETIHLSRKLQINKKNLNFLKKKLIFYL